MDEYIRITSPVRVLQISLADADFPRLDGWIGCRGARMYYKRDRSDPRIFEPYIELLKNNHRIQLHEGHFLVDEEDGIVSYPPEIFDAYYTPYTAEHVVFMPKRT